MKFAKGVTIEQIENVINWILADMKKEQLEAREAYKADTKDIFHGYMDTMYGFVEDMIRSRLSILCDEQERDLAFAELYEKIDEIPPGSENLSDEEIAKICTEAISSLYTHKKEDCEIAFGVKKKC